MTDPALDYSQIAASALAWLGPMSIQPEHMDAIGIGLSIHAGRTMPGDSRIRERIVGDLAIVPVYGMLTQRPNFITQMLGGTSTDQLGRKLRTLAATRSVKRIILDIDSRGGSIYGIQELAAEVQRLRKLKPIIAIANSIMTAAAYWIGAAASEVVVIPSGNVGGIGVAVLHINESERDRKGGLKYKYIYSGENKVDGNPHEPLSNRARIALQETVDGYANKFISDVARGRGVLPGKVHQDFGQGRSFGAQEALQRGLVDRIATLSDLLKGNPGRRSLSAHRAFIDSFERHSTPTTKQPNRKKKELATAYHEAGHAVAAYLHGCLSIEAVVYPLGLNLTNERGRITHGVTYSMPKSLNTCQKLAIVMAGPMAESLHEFGGPRRAFVLPETQQKAAEYGIHLSSRLFNNTFSQAKSLLLANWSVVTRLADQLTTSTISHQDISKLIARH